ncbi:interleukin-17 receptor D isoform X2 [Paramormyrops kingsleyae]|uniref:Si:ch211-207e14.4 n=1 Tax=Paramormyrops kingsleyae TaxID=1676925 RepID=A0A3B3RLW4_9TELE|nr:interleukin-17 receptor D-like isoform X2 [Paramormyrops kingsleyae]
MWIALLALCQVSSLHGTAGFHGDRRVFSPQNCSLDCILKGDSACEYCRITRGDVKMTLGITTAQMFGNGAGCVPLPCLSYLATPQGSDPCQHYVHAPINVTVEFMTNQNPTYDTVIISWRPSIYGIAFLRGFQVSLQALGGAHVECQLFLFQRNLSLSASHTERVYQSDPISQLPLASQFVVTVMALPVPELWDKFYQSVHFSTRTCPEKNGLEQCQRDWYPENVELRQEGLDIVVTFNLAPPHLGISHYFSWCYGGGMRNYTEIKTNPSSNKTHHSYHLLGLQAGTNYSCEIAADVVDAIRKTFSFRVSPLKQDDGPFMAETIIPAVLLFAAIVVVFVTAAITVVSKRKMKRRQREIEKIKPFGSKLASEEHSLVLIGKPQPPKLLICYSSTDGPAHVRVVMELAAFLQQHMAVQVSLDLWEVLSLMEEGCMSWYSQRIQESDFVLVICSQGLQQQIIDRGQMGLEADPGEGAAAALAAICLVGEELGRATAQGWDLSKFLTATFTYSWDADVPGLLGLAAHYTLMKDLPLLFSHLHRVPLHSPGRSLQVEHMTEETYSTLPAGGALHWAIQEARVAYEDQKRAIREARR